VLWWNSCDIIHYLIAEFAVYNYGCAMTPDEARTILTDLRMTVADVVEILASLGDDRPRDTIQRALYGALSLSRTETCHRPRVPWAVAGFLRVLALYRARVTDQRYVADFRALQARQVAPRYRRVKLRAGKRPG